MPDPHTDVIILDDDEDFANLLRLHCQNIGLSVQISADPVSFVDTFEKKPASLCVIDLNMADIHGVRWRFGGIGNIIEFRKRHGDAAKVAVLTGNLNPNIVSSCEEAGADAFIRKDLPLTEIVGRIEELARSAAAERMPAPARRKSA